MEGKAVNRKYLELYGWKAELCLCPGCAGRFHKLIRPDGTVEPGSVAITEDAVWTKAPPLHLDANLCFDELKLTGCEWSLECITSDDCEFKGPHMTCMIVDTQFDDFPVGCGVTPCDAMVSALYKHKLMLIERAKESQ